uniref:Uncharacterized protein n=1 Tax=Arundo donax TaxID=35708 RepID=A0A0A9H0H1_ARUDO
MSLIGSMTLNYIVVLFFFCYQYDFLHLYCCDPFDSRHHLQFMTHTQPSFNFELVHHPSTIV